MESCVNASFFGWLFPGQNQIKVNGIHFTDKLVKLDGFCTLQYTYAQIGICSTHNPVNLLTLVRLNNELNSHGLEGVFAINWPR